MATVIFLSTGILMAEPPPATEIDLAARKASVVTLEEQISQREDRLAELGQEILTLDARIEKRVDGLVRTLAKMKDSEESKTRVSQIKKDAIESLRAGIARYAAKRQELKEKIKKGDSAGLEDLSKFDDRISSRVDRIVELGKSFPTHKDVRKYVSDGGGNYWRGYYYENTAINPAWRQNRRDSTAARLTKNSTEGEIRTALGKMAQRRAALTDSLENRNLSEAERDLAIEELGRVDSYTEKLEANLSDLILSKGESATEATGRDQAIGMERLVDDAKRDLRQDVSRLFQLYDEYDKRRSDNMKLRENLAARKEWLEKNAVGEN